MNDEDAAEYVSALRSSLDHAGFGWVVEQVDGTEEEEDADREDYPIDVSRPQQELTVLIDATISAIRDRRDTQMALLQGLDAEVIVFRRDAGSGLRYTEEGFKIERLGSDDDALLQDLLVNLLKLRGMAGGR